MLSIISQTKLLISQKLLLIINFNLVNTIELMKKLARFFSQKLLKLNKDSAFSQLSKAFTSTSPPAGFQFYKKCWDSTLSIHSDIKLNQFTKVAIVGPCSHFIISEIFQRRVPQQLTICDESEESLKYTLSNLADSGILKMFELNNVQLKTSIVSNNWEFGENSFNLVISCLHLHSVNSIENFLGETLNSLEPDGCLIATTLGPETLQELRISFVLAENERYGGVSPHVSPFIVIAQIGNILHRCGYRITTISRNKSQQTFSNPLELMNQIKLLGQNSCLIGKRKGAFKDLFIAMTAIYSSIFSESQSSKIQVTIDIINFIGWKYSKEQILPAKRGSQNISFQDWVKELQEVQGEKLKYGQINQQGQQTLPPSTPSPQSQSSSPPLSSPCSSKPNPPPPKSK